MIRKTMRIGEVRTSIKLEKEFWTYLKEVAGERSLRLSGLVNEVAEATPERTNLASTLRTFALSHARLRSQTLQRELERLSLAGNTQDLVRVLEACPLPCLVLDAERQIRQLNRAFALWLNLDPARDGRAAARQHHDPARPEPEGDVGGSGRRPADARRAQCHLRLARQGAHLAGDGPGVGERQRAQLGPPRVCRHVRDTGRSQLKAAWRQN